MILKIRLWNRFALFCISCLTVQQLINASSNYWMVYLQRHFHLPQKMTWGLLGLFSSFLLPYFPAALAVWAKTRWSQEVIWNYIGEFAEKNRANIALFSDARAKERTLQIVSNEGIRTFEEAIQYFNQVATSSLNITCNVLAFGLLIDYRFLIAHLCSVGFGFAIIKAQNARQVDLFQKAQNERIEVGQLLLTSADNVLLGNSYNYRNWRRNLTRKMSKSMLSQQWAVRFREAIAILASWATYAPCLALAFWIGSQNGYRAEVTSKLIALLPRLSIVLSYTYYMVFLLSQWSSYRARLKVVEEVITSPPTNARDLLNARITWKNIEWAFSGKTPVILSSWNEIDSLLQNQRGRITLRGKNGSGKSTLLLLLKLHLGESSFLLPTHHHLRFRYRAKTRSTGEQFTAQIDEISQALNEQIFLLDEWDANLDEHNMQRISDRIDRLAENNIIIEVRHRS